MITFSPTPARPTTPKLARRLCAGLGMAMPIALAIEAAAGTADIDAASGTWTTAAPLPEERTEISVSTDGERLFLLGGFAPDPEQRASAPRGVFAYDPAADAWERITELPEGLNHAGLAYYDGALYVVGGYREASFDAIRSLRIYDIEADEWRDGPDLPTARGALAVAVHDGRIHAISGVDADGDNTGAHEVFDIQDESWSTLADLPSPRDHIGAASVEGEIVVLAGRDDTSDTLTYNEVYVIDEDTWRDGTPVPTGRSGVAVVERDGWVYIFGGETFQPNRTFPEAERFDPAEDRWEALPPMPTGPSRPRRRSDRGPHPRRLGLAAGRLLVQRHARSPRGRRLVGAARGRGPGVLSTGRARRS